MRWLCLFFLVVVMFINIPVILAGQAEVDRQLVTILAALVMGIIATDLWYRQ